MEWMLDPAAWVGFLTLVVLEIVLGIDNLVFIAILTDKLSPDKKDKARVLGLSLALFMRLGLLAGISWLVRLTAPLFSVAGLNFSGRDLILLTGGLFLLFKATTELHERLEGKIRQQSRSSAYAGFGVVVAQIVALDAVFSLDSVITAVGMVDDLGVMMSAVVVAVILMLFASKPLTQFINAHPSLVVLCLSFLLMIGLSLVAEGFEFHIPKGYLYAAIGFSILIEFFNQLAQRNFARNQARIPFRERTAEAVLRMLGKKDASESQDSSQAEQNSAQPAFAEEERLMVSEVLSLADRPIRTIMTPRREITWIATNDTKEVILDKLRRSPHSVVPVCRGGLDDLIGVARVKDLLQDLFFHGKLAESGSSREPVVLHNSTGVLKAMELLKQSDSPIALVADEFGTLQGLITPIDILEAIAGEFPDEGEKKPIEQIGRNVWTISGTADVRLMQETLGIKAEDGQHEEHRSISELLLSHFGKLPEAGATLDLGGFRFKVTEVADHRIVSVTATIPKPDNAGRAEPQLD
ncbi:MAG: TerC family protein [Burkholderiaceae bacterium]